MLLQQSLGVVLSDLLPRHFPLNLFFKPNKKNQKMLAKIGRDPDQNQKYIQYPKKIIFLSVTLHPNVKPRAENTKKVEILTV